MSENQAAARLEDMNAQDFFPALLGQLLHSVSRGDAEAVAAVAKTIAGQAQHAQLSHWVAMEGFSHFCEKSDRQRRRELGSTGEYCSDCGDPLGEFGVKECGCDLTDDIIRHMWGLAREQGTADPEFVQACMNALYSPFDATAAKGRRRLARELSTLARLKNFLEQED